MTKNQLMEHLSKNFIRSLKLHENIKFNSVELDSGVDLQVLFTYKRQEPNGSYRYSTNGDKLDIQLKSTTESKIIINNNLIKYDLKLKNYNDIIYRRNFYSYNPFILILFILPDSINNWIKCEIDHVKLYKTAFWFYPDNSYQMSNNKKKVRIRIPLVNKLDLDCFTYIFNQIKSI